MSKLEKKWKIFVINHAHTDIGYTHLQEQLEMFHADFIRQAISYLNQIHDGSHVEWKGYKWTCENMWQVEQFLQSASEEEKSDFNKYVKSGEIGLSGNYLNLTELIGADVLYNKVKRGIDKVRDIKEVKCGMTADINGYAWGYSQAMYDNGVENLISCIHTHHGMFPLNQKQCPFWWETPNGKKLLTWVGDVYHLGNEFNFAPKYGTTYTVQDELQDKLMTDGFEVSSKRVFRYLKNMELEGHVGNILPIMVSGVITDNAPPNPRIMEFINEWNSNYENEVELVMSNLDDFFSALRETTEDIPTYKGDFNDWWADGCGSTPLAVKTFRDAQRKYSLCKHLDANGTLGDDALMELSEDNQMLYAEHTWGYSSSVAEPWETMVNELDIRKTNYAVEASKAATKNLLKILALKGEQTITAERDKYFKVINPFDFEVTDVARIELEYWENVDGLLLNDVYIDEKLEIVDASTGEKFKFQSAVFRRSKEFEVPVTLKPLEEKILKVVLKKDEIAYPTSVNYAKVGADRVMDFVPIARPKVIANNFEFENDFYKIKFGENGIESLILKNTGKDLLRENSVPAFSGVYERTPMDGAKDCTNVRRLMGRNRKCHKTERYFSKFKDINLISSGSVFSLYKLDFELVGTKFYSVLLKIYNDFPRINTLIRIHKESFWEPENLYVALPFTTQESEELFIDKTGCIIRPGIDQLPYTNQEFYLLQNGAAYVSNKGSLAIGIKDTPLIVLGDLKAHEIELCSGDNKKLNNSTLYSWCMNNFWETNFKVDLSGFYEFEYNLEPCNSTNEVEVISFTNRINLGLISFACKN